MKKVPPSKSLKKSTQAKSQLKLTYYILLFSYLLVPVFTPGFGALDTNGPKFLAIAILNLIALPVLLIDAGRKSRIGIQSGFFRNHIGLAYSLFVLISLLSFTQAINLSESLINFAKIITVFTATYVLYLIFSSNRSFLLHAAVGLALLLLFDSFMAFYQILDYVNHKITSIYDIKSIYSNKNIFAAALFIKIPATVWLILFTDKWKKKLGYLTFLTGVISVLFLVARAFYFGLVLLLVALALFFIVRYFVKRNNLSVKRISLFAGFFVMALAVVFIVQKFYLTNNQDEFNKTIADRVSQIRFSRESSNQRFATWERSFRLIRENPFLGVGTGNWKVAELKYEAPEREDFIISYKSHNDFIEVTAETGLPGGVIYLSIFILILANFIRKALNRSADEEIVQHLFLPAFGIIAYSVDAFFNFPNDRPEIQALFAIFVSMAIAFSGTALPTGDATWLKQPSIQKKSRSIPAKFALAISFLVLSAFVIVLAMNAKSIHYQRMEFLDGKSNKYSYPSSFFIKNFPPIPDLNCVGAPISTCIARYLIKENRNKEAVRLLIKDNPSPYDGRREYLLSMAYDKMGITDSMIYWVHKFYELKPLFPEMVLSLSSKEFYAGRQQEAIEIMDRYLSRIKTNSAAWLLAIDQNLKAGDQERALLLMDSAVKYFPQNKQIKSLLRTVNISPYEALYNLTTQSIADEKFAEAIILLNDFISKKPEYTEAYQRRAYCLYSLGEYSKSLLDVEKALSKGDGDEAALTNLSGSSYLGLGKTKEACLEFKKSMDKGNADGTTNYRKFCQGKKKK